MNIFSIFTLLGGLAFFLYGISTMSSGLEKIAGGKLEGILKKMTSNPIKGFALGAFVTAVIQSSSAVTVMRQVVLLIKPAYIVCSGLPAT